MNKKLRIAATIMLGLALAGGALRADEISDRGSPTEQVAVLLDVAQVGPLMQVVATEGARHGLSLEDSLFPGRGGAEWKRAIGRIQSPGRLTPIIGETLSEMLSPADADAAHAFLTSNLGRRIVDREVTARRAMLDRDVEASARSASAMLRGSEHGRSAAIDELIDALDLVAANVSGGMNANFAFYRGLADGGAMTRRMAEDEILALVRGQETDIRLATQEWLHAYLMMAYSPLTDADLAEYVAFSRTSAGRRYNSAMFAGFGRVFETTSYDLGLAAARFIIQKDT